MVELADDLLAAREAAEAADLSTAYLLERIRLVERRVQFEVERRRGRDTTPADAGRFRGLYVSDDRADELLAAGPAEPLPPDPAHRTLAEGLERQADELEADGTALRLRTLARAADLHPLDVELLCVAVAPDLDQRFEPLYGYLNDDVSQRRATVGLALTLCGMPTTAGRARARLAPGAPLVDLDLVTVEQPDRPVLTRTLRVPDRVGAFLLGGDRVDDRLHPHVVTPPPLPGPCADDLARAIAAGHDCAYLRDGRGASAESTAVAALARLGRAAVVLDLTTVDTDAVDAVATAAHREARLRDAGLVVGPVDVLADAGAGAVAAFARPGHPVVLHGTPAWDPTWSAVAPVLLDADRADEPARIALWRDALGDVPADLDVAAATAPFRLRPDQVVRAATSAHGQAAAHGRPLEPEDLQRGARSQNATGLQRLARRIDPRATWDDLVVPSDIEAQLRELTSRWRHRDLVLESWGLGRGSARGRGVSALFAGPSGTGKTLSSEVLAHDLGLDLYVVDLSTVIDKYIGETSKNLARIFDEADRVNGVLLFDEADALFGKRSSVSDSKDRHANVEVAFLLQRMEAFDGVAILTTNLAANLDEAFMRRLDAVVDFPSPDEVQRRDLWSAQLRGDLPHDDDIDLDLLADRFRMSGSEIRNVVVSAAYRAAAGGRTLTMADLVQAVVREHRKIGRHLSSGDLAGLDHLLAVQS